MSETPEGTETCDVCGKPATNSAVDILHYPNYATGWMEAKPVGQRRFGCDEHPAPELAVEFHSSGPLVP